MCVVSFVADHYRKDWGEPWVDPNAPYTPTHPNSVPNIPTWPQREKPITDEEIREFRRLLEMAKELDRKLNQPECEMEEKRQYLERVAKALGVDLPKI